MRQHRRLRTLAALIFMIMATQACIFSEDPADTPACRSTQTDEALCKASATSCGVLETLVDDCGINRRLSCGCSVGDVCDMTTNTCVEEMVCRPESDAQICDARGATCGELTVVSCGEARTVVCGMCGIDDVCVQNTCECLEPPSDPVSACNEFECGEVAVPFLCSEGAELINCGTCSNNFFCNAEAKCQDLRINTVMTRRNERFGSVIAMNGPNMAVSKHELNLFNTSPQQVTLFQFSDVDQVWVEGPTLEPKNMEGNSDKQDIGLFGASLAMTTQWLAVGSPGRDNASTAEDEDGAVYLYERDGQRWELRHRILGERGARFGVSVAMRGNLLVVGEPGSGKRADKGQIHVFELGSALTPVFFTDVDNNNDTELGQSVAIAQEDRIVVGAPRFSAGGGAVTGRVFVLSREADRKTWVVQSILKPETLVKDMYFGGTLAINGSFVAVGATYAGNLINVALLPGNVSNGQVDVFDMNGPQPRRVITLRHPEGVNRDLFGHSIAFDKNRILIGAPGWGTRSDMPRLDWVGNAVLFTFEQDMNASQGRVIQEANMSPNVLMGTAVALSDRWGAIGLPGLRVNAVSEAGQVQLLDFGVTLEGPSEPDPGL